MSKVYSNPTVNYVNNEHYMSNGANNVIFSGSGYARTDKISIPSGFTHIETDNLNNSYVLFWTGGSVSHSYSSTSANDYGIYLGRVNTTEFEIPSGVEQVSFQVYYDGTSPGWDNSPVSFTNFQTLNPRFFQIPTIPISLGRKNYLSFDGVDDYIDMGTLGNFGSQMFNFEIEYIYSTTSTTENTLHFGTRNPGDTVNIQFTMNSSDATGVGSALIGLRNDSQPIVFYSFDGLPTNGDIAKVNFSFNNNVWEVKINDVSRPLTNRFNTAINLNDDFSNFQESFVFGAFNNIAAGASIGSFSNFNLYDVKLYSNNNLFLHYDMTVSGNQLIDQVGNNDATIVGATAVSEANAIQNIYKGDTLIPRVYLANTLIYGDPPFGLYELIADVDVTTATTQIDFDNLNITKDDELRLVYTYKGDSTTTGFLRLFANNNTTLTNYHSQELASFTIVGAGRGNHSNFVFARSNKVANGFVDIKVSNNDRFVASSQFLYGAGGGLVEGLDNFNVVGSGFTLTSITSSRFKTSTI